LACFFQGFCTRLSASQRSARAMRRRVPKGMLNRSRLLGRCAGAINSGGRVARPEDKPGETEGQLALRLPEDAEAPNAAQPRAMTARAGARSRGAVG
jgi:hypothetical protein